ncbi:AsmA-like C-terminal region [Devosia lucknowensis]|uniref:AsmA-like C-terminal region n=1 Tax=Devosia lucknowensis TaxID=1096929 RepID=A0A1Y6F4Z6_9HYPH|nr:AsmA family protein [Devosia lucknowensis]SMQ69965.1 AsmA-like C-terminal region [Devosia lucknowensis]
MLNRIYIVVGIFAIVVLAGAFLVPRFITWGDYRDRMEVLASGVLGADVTIRGDISFSLLPSPRLAFTDVVVGDAESPAATVGAVEAEFVLMDFLRDIYNVTALSLERPVVNLTIDENGLLSSGVDLSGAGAGVALGHAGIANGSLRLEDLRSAETYVLDRVDGDLRLSSLSGPFQFQGAGNYGETRYDLRFNSAAVDGDGNTRVSSFLREALGAYSLTLDGTLSPGAAPRFAGTMAYRQAPPQADAADDIRGDLLLESEVTINTDRVVLSGYTLNPDQNRAGMRLTGAASIRLGVRPSFDAVVSGGVFSLPPRDASEVAAEQPYEFVRLLLEIPAPPLPPIEGRLGIDLAEVGLRGFALREVRVDATTDGATWTVEQAVARLPGETEMRFSGTASNDGGVAGFVGDVSVVSRRLEALSQVWKRPVENNPLFNMQGSLTGRLMLAGDAFGLSNGRLTLDGQEHGLELRIGFGAEPRLDTVLTLGQLDTLRTQALEALVPDVTGDANFAISFPDGSFSITAGRVDVMGLPAQDLVAEAQWSPSAVRFSRLAASDWGGVMLNTTARISGTLAQPWVTGSGDLGVADPDAPGLGVIYEMAGIPFGWQQAIARALPFSLQFILSDVDGGEGQVLTAGGDVGAARLDLRAEMAGGLPALAVEDLRLVGSLEAQDSAAALSQFGWDSVAFADGEGSLLASLFAEGSGTDGFEGRVALSQGSQSISYAGGLRLSGSGEIAGEGTLEVLLDDGSAIATLAGVGGSSLPGLEATAALQFEGLRSLALDGISGVAGDTGFGGRIAMQRSGQMPSFSGAIDADGLELAGLAGALFGESAFIGAVGAVWPEGPLAASDIARPSRGDITITAPSISLGGRTVSGETTFNYVWGPESVSIKGLGAAVGGGSLDLTVDLCCAGPLTDRTVSGQATVSGVDLGAIAPGLLAQGLSGRLDGGVQFEGSGASLADVMRGMTGEGNFAVADFAAEGLAGEVFPAISAFEDVLNTDADALETLISLALARGPFTADQAQGAFTIAGGTVRLANLIIEGTGARLAGSLNLMLDQLDLDGRFVLTPRDFNDPNGLVQSDTARIVAQIAGTLLTPEVTVDLAEMVASIQVRANELEVDRLEALRLEDEARQRAAAEERNRLIEERRRREEALRMEELRQLEEEMDRIDLPPELSTPQQPEPAAPSGPLNLGFQPGVNQPIGNDVNQPIQLFPSQ